MTMSDLDILLRQHHDLTGQLNDLTGRILGMLAGAPAEPRQPTASAAGGRFDYSNRAHRTAAEVTFKRLGINEKRQSWIYNNRLYGVRIGDVERVIEEADAEYRRMFPRAPDGNQRRSGGNRRGGTW